MSQRTESRIRSGASIVVLLLLGALVLAGCGSDGEPDAADGPGDGIVVEDARARMSPRMAGVAAAYLDLTNTGMSDDRLVAASVAPEVAGHVEIHESFEMDDDARPGAAHGEGPADGTGQMHGEAPMAGAPMMGMREIDGIDLPVGATVELVPGGLHLMLMELVDALEPGQLFELTLVFEHAPELTVTVEVREQV
jgi:periplasmic copper chaperone A